MMDTQEVRLAHALPGRLRFKVPAIRRNVPLVREIERRFRSVDGMRDVEVNPTTGSVLLRYEPAEMTLDGVLAAAGDVLHIRVPHTEIPLNGSLESPEPRAPAAPSRPSPLSHQVVGFFRWLDGLIESATAHVVDLNVLVPLVFFSIGLGMLVLSDTLAFPVWYEFLWFSFAVFMALNPLSTEVNSI